ncbi:MAG: DNA (cytosine-5-)-methyltransferase [Microcoleus sp. PH2017_25_DOB_D_A]|uniref:DNA (cytosine-5-)-methyltransferase n=1 Tax=unclassified Microcoleus TaxID=2642155 RepID=UPI001E01CCE8|nr:MULTISPECIES: DNA (cytosine-5-)-methyltransferase [unclassified Microcoleus]TAE38633.1 MAG: DNA (cytosine-5-)-methyltransferase [Oscillatoriales cyanobacterium]MCC3535687.1 DNA (cytosine-5-)-methyltransferase [Microcoleus sp. PH2017_25_DOB_D_A]MCC3547748.1 DNA (cytosine-5-)-methyltransferase [Microcoleus sp. PH2017_24_DOB_U_A]MCC3572040.1 DNA (cytosine-5-)-methyltransferase [Microcoleus sp. PH2017_34_RAT_O_A]MCC3609715.1 DNA (cytosine-5-)-methyltransferase [Microcoleus sp. PH2017_40_RAT_O_B
MQKIRFIDLFSGIGGMRLAFEAAAHSLNLETECVLSSEINPDAQLVYQTNFGDTPSGDIRLIDQLPEHDILLAGFPCQSFSYAGKKAGFGDTRGTLFFEIVRLIDTFKPQAFIFENVRGLVSHDSGQTLETIKSEMTDRGYSFDYFILNSSNFSLPQNRVRVYLVGILNASPQFGLISDLGPKDSHSCNHQQLSLFSPLSKPVAVADILEDNPDQKYDCSPEFVKALKPIVNNDLNRLHGIRLIDYRGGNSIHSWELGLRGQCSLDEIELMNRFILKRRNKEFGHHQDGKLLTKEQIATFFAHPNLDEILDLLVAKKYLQRNNDLYKPVSGNFSFEVYKFLDPQKISVTLVASDANKLGVYHNHRVRRITPREAARLQGFSDSFVLHSNDDKAYYQLGNSVSINVVKAVAKEVMQNVLSSTKQKVSAF